MIQTAISEQGCIAMAGSGTQAAVREPTQQAGSELKAASAAHEVKNFAESLTALVYLLQRNPSLDENSRRYVQQIENELERMRYVLAQMLVRYREIADPAPRALSKILDTVLEFHEDEIARKHIEVEKRYKSEGSVSADAEDLRQIFSNLVMNAIRALRPGGKLSIGVREAHNWRGVGPEGFRVVVADNGIGIPRQHRNKVLRGLFTSKDKRGSGLGLWITSKLVAEHNGTIRFRSNTKRGHSGTVFSVFLPLASNANLKMPGEARHGSLTGEESMGTMPRDGNLRRPAETRRSAKENRAMSERLMAENRRLLEAIDEQRRRFNDLATQANSNGAPTSNSRD